VSGRLEQGPKSGRRWEKGPARSLPIGLILLSVFAGDAAGQTLTPDMLRGERDGFVGQNRPLRRIGDTANNATDPDSNVPSLRRAQPAPAPSRIGRIPTFEAPAAAGAKAIGFDSLNRKKRPPRRRPGVSATVVPAVSPTLVQAASPRGAPAEPAVVRPIQITPVIVPVVPPPPPLPSAATAHRARLAPSIMGTVEGQPYRRRLRVDDDPFGPAGFYRGSMLVKPAVELWTGYDTNPARVIGGKGSWLYMVAPELLVTSDWERHSLIADLRGSFTGYSLKNDVGSAAPINIDRPDFTGTIRGRLDVSRDTRINSETRFRIGTDNPGSPNIQANLARYPLFFSAGNTIGGSHTYNRFELAANGSVDRTVYEESTLSDGSRSSNSDRNFNQFGGSLRGSYEILPHVRPFGEVQIDRRERDIELDRNGFARSSNGRTARVGSTFELGRLITGEASIGYTTRSYEDARLQDAKGLLVAGSLIWRPTGLTTVTLGAQSSVDESTLQGVSGVLTRSYNAQVEHAFRRYLIATLKAGYTTADYDGSDRFDKIYSVGGDLVYKFNRDLQLKAQLRHDWLRSTIASADYDATLFMLGVRLQR
jgi:hypothetical protein